MAPRLLAVATRDGMEVPVIDVTSPAFRVDPSDAELAELTTRFIDESIARESPPPAMLAALQSSVLGRALMSARGTFLTGLHTYLLKLGPDNLWPGAGEIDRRIAASFPAFTSRLRVQDMARLLAEAIVAAAPAPGRPLCFVNIAGGPAADSWNALLVLRTERPALLSGRRLTIAVFDPDTDGPALGASAVARLSAADGPLAGLDIEFRPIPLPWSDAAALGSRLEELGARDAFCAASSEGGLFEYGSDDEIRTALAMLAACTAPDTVVAGSVTRDGEATRASHRSVAAATRPRTLESFSGLVQAVGWDIERAIERPFSYHVRAVRQR